MNILNNNIMLLTLLATFFTFLITSLGSAIVFFFKKVNKNILDIMLSLSAGVMLAASYFSLLNPAIILSTKLNMTTWLVLILGFIIGGLLLYFTGFIFNKKTLKKRKKNNLKRCLMLFLSITIHNIPEGMAIGVAFASTSFGIEGATIEAAMMLGIGIGIQNFPEGCAVALPLRREGLSRFKSFLFGVLSGSVEVISGILGALLVLKIRVLLPYLLSFAAGAMIYVVVEELIPESQTNKNKNIMTLFTIIGFSIMMALDVALS